MDTRVVVLMAVALAVCAPAATPGASAEAGAPGATSCTERAQYVPTASATEIVVPVTVHLMKYRHDKFPHNDIEGTFAVVWIEQLLDTAGPVNAIWRQAKIRLTLHRVEVCEYALEDFGLGPR